MPKFRWAIKVPLAALISFAPAVALTVLIVSIYLWNTVNAGCDCYSTKMSLSATAFQHHLPTIKIIGLGVFAALTALMSFIPWQPHRLIAFFAGLLLGLAVWISFGDQPYTHEYYKRWTMVPLDRISVSLTAEYASGVAIVARHRFVAAFSMFAFCVLGTEFVRLLLRWQKTEKNSPPNRQNAGQTPAINPTQPSGSDQPI